jgi:deoxycytidine triphosphate deaminase
LLPELFYEHQIGFMAAPNGVPNANDQSVSAGTRPRAERQPNHQRGRVELRLRYASGGRRLSYLFVGSRQEIDPKHFNESDSLIEPNLRVAEDGAKYYLLPPHHYGLGVTVETFKMPRNVTGLAIGKSTYARAGLLVNATPLEAGWEGRLVVEIANLANLPLRVYVNEGIGQILFFESDEDCAVSIRTAAENIRDKRA